MIGCYMFPLLSDMVLYEVTFTRCPAAGLACIPQAANLQLDYLDGPRSQNTLPCMGFKPANSHKKF